MKSFEERTKEFCERSIYSIECVDKYFYIGESKTHYLNTYRIPQQFGQNIGIGKQSQFCQKHKPIRVDKRIHLGTSTYEFAEYMEDAVTQWYKQQYGDDKVEGGTYCLKRNKKLSNKTKEEILNVEIR